MYSLSKSASQAYRTTTSTHEPTLVDIVSPYFGYQQSATVPPGVVEEEPTSGAGTFKDPSLKVEPSQSTLQNPANKSDETLLVKGPSLLDMILPAVAEDEEQDLYTAEFCNQKKADDTESAINSLDEDIEACSDSTTVVIKNPPPGRIVAPKTEEEQDDDDLYIPAFRKKADGTESTIVETTEDLPLDADIEAPSNTFTASILYSNDPNAKRPEVRHTSGDDLFEEEEEEEQYESPKGAFGGFQGCMRDRHIKHTALYLANFIYLSAWWHHLRTSDCSSIWSDDCKFYWTETPWLVFFFWLFLYIPFLWEFFNSSTARYLRYINTTESILEYLERLYNTEPTIALTIECYHMETRLTTHVDANGNVVTSTQTVPVVTYTESEDVDIVAWTDESIPLRKSQTREYQVTKVKLEKTFEGDYNYNQQVMDLIERNKLRDVFYSLVVDYRVTDFQNRVLAFVDIQDKPFLLDYRWCVLAHVTLFLSWPYRFWMSAITGKVQTTVHKSIQSRYHHRSSSPYRDIEERDAEEQGPDKEGAV